MAKILSIAVILTAILFVAYSYPCYADENGEEAPPPEEGGESGGGEEGEESTTNGGMTFPTFTTQPAPDMNMSTMSTMEMTTMSTMSTMEMTTMTTMAAPNNTMPSLPQYGR